LAAALAGAAAACSPLAPALTGSVAPVRIPSGALPPGYHKLVFDFAYHDPDFSLKGDGAARLASPDSMRLDFFVNNEAAGEAVIIDDTLRDAHPKAARQLLPPVPFFWAALGVLRVPPAADTVARVDGDTLRIEIGTHPAWRATFMGTELLRLDLIDDGRIPQSVMRVPGAPVRFRDARAHRSLEITVRATDSVPPFDAIIWR
jgi:hypothetical protein